MRVCQHMVFWWNRLGSPERFKVIFNRCLLVVLVVVATLLRHRFQKPRSKVEFSMSRHLILMSWESCATKTFVLSSNENEFNSSFSAQFTKLRLGSYDTPAMRLDINHWMIFKTNKKISRSNVQDPARLNFKTMNQLWKAKNGAGMHFHGPN